MKKYIFIFGILLFGFYSHAQSKQGKKNKNAKITIEVDGICGMCKKRIETAALKTKGVKYALWNVKTHQLNLIINEHKTTLSTVQKNIAAVGHDSEGYIASEEAYNSVHPCCKYRDEEIILDHKGGLKKQKKNRKNHEKKEVVVAKYQCPMKCEKEKVYDKEGRCSVCEMKLKEIKVKKK